MKGIAVIIGLNFIALVAIFIFFKRRIDKSLRTDEVVNAIRSEIEQLIIELNQTTNRNVDIIEERIGRLKEVSAAAEKQIKILMKEVDKKAKEGDTYSKIKPVLPVTAEKVFPATMERISTRERVISLFFKGESTEKISKELGITLAEVELIISLENKK